MNMKGWVSAAINVLSENSEAIAAGAAILGVVATAVLASKVAREAEDTLDDAKEELKEAADKPEKKKEIKKACAVKLVKLYLPAVISGTLTIVCIVVSVKEGHKHQAAAIASACSASQTALLEYKEKAKEILGEKDIDKVEDAIAEERVRNADVSQAIKTGLGDDYIMGAATGQILESSIEFVRREWNRFAKDIPSEPEPEHSLGAWACRIHGEDSWMADDLYFVRTDLNQDFELVERAHMMRNGKICYYIDYTIRPVPITE